MTGFDKFGWLKALQSDPRYTDKEQRFGSIICVQFARRDGTGWTVQLDDIAAKMPSGMTRNRMKVALAKFVRDGYLQETGKSLGGRGVKAWRSHDLTKPAPVGVQVSDETRTSTGAGLGETRTSTGQNPHQKVTKPAPESDTKTSSELREDPPKGTSEGIPEGSEPRASAPPPSRCPKHINHDNPPPCYACGQARVAAEAFALQQAEARKQELREAWENVRNCTICDGSGLVEVDESTVEHCQCREGIAVCN